MDTEFKKEIYFRKQFDKLQTKINELDICVRDALLNAYDEGVKNAEVSKASELIKEAIEDMRNS